MVFDLHVAFFTVQGKQSGPVNIENFDVVVDGLQEFADNPLPESMVIAATEIDRLAVAAVGIEVAGGDFAAVNCHDAKAVAKKLTKTNFNYVLFG